MEYQWENEEGASEITNIPRRPLPRDKSLYGDDEGDSVSTFRTAGTNIQDRLEEAARQSTPTHNKGPGNVITPAVPTQHVGTRISSTSSITSTLDGTMESRISSLESATEQTNRMMQDMMKMMERFTRTQDNPNRGSQQSRKVTMTTEQYISNPLRGETPE